MKKIISNIDEYVLTDTDKDVIKKINKNYELFLESTISTFSKEIFVSASSLSRIARKLGFKNYSMFKLFVMNEATKNNKSKIQKVEIGQDKLGAIGTIYMEVVSQNMIGESKKEIYKLATAIVKSDTILAFGAGTSSIPIEHLIATLDRFGINSYFSSDMHKMIAMIERSRKDSVLILLSKSFETREVIFLLNEAERKNISVYCITSNKSFSKRKRSGVIYFNHLPQKKWKYSISSKIASLFIIDVLISNILTILGEENINNENVNKMLKKWNTMK